MSSSRSFSLAHRNIRCHFEDGFVRWQALVTQGSALSVGRWNIGVGYWWYIDTSASKYALQSSYVLGSFQVVLLVLIFSTPPLLLGDAGKFTVVVDLFNSLL